MGYWGGSGSQKEAVVNELKKKKMVQKDSIENSERLGESGEAVCLLREKKNANKLAEMHGGVEGKKNLTRLGNPREKNLRLAKLEITRQPEIGKGSEEGYAWG